MGAIADLSQLVNTATGGTGAKEFINYYVDNRIGSGAGAAAVAGQYTSLWTFNRFPRGAGDAAGGTAINPDNTTQGALGQVDASGGRTKYCSGAFTYASVACVVSWYDRLAVIGGLSGSVTTAQSTTGLSVTRYTGAESAGNEIWIEIYTIIGTTATTLTVSYTNQDGTSGRTSSAVVIGGAGRREATRLIRIPLTLGDTGVRSVESVTLAGTTGTAGDFGVVIQRRLLDAAISFAGTRVLTDMLTQLGAYPQIKDGACLYPIVYASTVASPVIGGSLSFVEA
jgi:hypothetical protein